MYEKEIQEARRLLDELEFKQKKFNSLSDEQKLAIKLHELTCHSNHIDVCSWEYEVSGGGTHNWDKDAHKMYLNKASRLLGFLIQTNVSTDTAIKIYKLIK